jgi:hypothetical protein
MVKNQPTTDNQRPTTMSKPAPNPVFQTTKPVPEPKTETKKEPSKEPSPEELKKLLGVE